MVRSRWYGEEDAGEEGLMEVWRKAMSLGSAA
jgi:hypothetical protein